LSDTAEAVAAWTLFYEASPDAAWERAGQMVGHGIPEGHTAEWLGANLALTPREHRCPHWGDDRNCPQCGLGRWRADAAKDQAERVAGEQAGTIRRQSEAVERQLAEIRRLRQREWALRALLAAKRPRKRRFLRRDDGQGGNARHPRRDSP
jgi:hypothetical protein